MIVYRISGDGLLALVRAAAAAPNVDPHMLLGIVMGCDREDEQAEMPDVRDGPMAPDGVPPAKPEDAE